MSASPSLSSSTRENFITLKSKDEKCFTVKESVAFLSVKIKDMVKSCPDSSAITLSNVESGTLAMLLEYLNKHGDSEVSAEDKRKYSEELAKKPLAELFDFFTAAVDLEIKDLPDVISTAIIDNINAIKLEGSDPVPFDMENDQTPADEDATRDENYRPWSDFD